MAKQHTRPDLHAAIEQRYQNNTTGDITPEDLRDGLHELVDSAFLPASDTQLTAQLLGIDAATGEFLVLLSPSAPTAKASYVLADLAGSLAALPASASIASRVLRLPASVSGQTLCLLDANKLPVPLQHLERLPVRGSLLITAREDVFVDTTYATPATYLNTALTIRSYAQASVAVSLPPLTTQLVPALLRIKHESGIGGTTCLLSVPGLGRPLAVGEHVYLAAVATPAIPPSSASGYPGAPAGTAWVVLSEPDPRAQVDLLGLTGAQMLEVMALTYTNCDAGPADSPPWSFPGMWFDAIDPANGSNYRYTCGRSPFIPGNNTSGSGPAWTRLKKL